MQQKIRAYTLMEVTVAMLISAIVITMCYSAYNIIGAYYKEFSAKNEASASLQSLTHTLEMDFLKSDNIVRDENRIILSTDSATITYQFGTVWVTRKLNQLHIDTFRLEHKPFATYFEQTEVLHADTIDQINFEVVLPQRIVPIQVSKIYSAENLF